MDEVGGTDCNPHGAAQIDGTEKTAGIVPAE
jgi:hypothetical protein